MDVGSAVALVVLLILVGVFYVVFYQQGATSGASVTVAEPPAQPTSTVQYAPDVSASVHGHQQLNWDLPVEGLHAQPYQPITFRPDNPAGWLDNFGSQNAILWDLSKTGTTCGPDIENPPFHQSHNLCYYTRAWTQPVGAQV